VTEGATLLGFVFSHTLYISDNQATSTLHVSQQNGLLPGSGLRRLTLVGAGGIWVGYPHQETGEWARFQVTLFPLNQKAQNSLDVTSHEGSKISGLWV
jgi:hypothetical protein